MVDISCNDHAMSGMPGLTKLSTESRNSEPTFVLPRPLPRPSLMAVGRGWWHGGDLWGMAWASSLWG